MTLAAADDPSAGQPAPLGRVVIGGVIGGAIAAAAAGAIDGLWSWDPASQFLQGAAGKLRFVVFLVVAYAFAGAVIGALAAGLATLFSRWTRLGDVLRAGVAHYRQARERDASIVLGGLSLAVAGVPIVAGSVAATYLAAAEVLPDRKHMGLIIAVAMAAVIAAIAVGVLVTFVVARLLESLLRMMLRGPAAGRLPGYTPLLAFTALVALTCAAVLLTAWDTIELLHLRWLWITTLALVLAIPAVRLGNRLALRLDTTRPMARAGIVVCSVLLLAPMTLGVGGSTGIRKAADRYSGLGGPLIAVYQRVGDLDGDGYSRLLGGGDCDDSDADIHPGAAEIPDDGIDQNCVGGDATAIRKVGDVRFAPVPATVPKDLNVILITIDTVRADHFSAYGHRNKTTPRIDALAAEGTLFTNAWAHAPSTRYSVPAIITGRYPLDVYYDRSVSGWPGLLEKNQTIAEILKARGLVTGAILNYWYFDRQRKISQGFDSYDNHNRRLHKGVTGEGPAHSRGSSSKQQTDKALAYVTSHASERFFLWVHYYDPHYEYEKHPEIESFGDTKADLYDNEIRFTDMHIGRLFDGLKHSGVYDRTAVVITGDHGEGFGEHGIDMHGYHLYAAQTKVPLIIRVPGIAPSVVDMPVGHVDILPTLANLTGAAPTSEMMGRSLLGPIAGTAPRDEDRYVFQQLSFENSNEMRAVVSKRCHVIFNVSPKTSWELYRIDEDPLEKRDLIDSPGDCAPARDALAAWYDQSQIPAGAGEALLPGRPEIAHTLDVDFGDEIRLLAVDLPTGPVRPGTSFEVTWTFEARGTLRGGWRMFAHFEGPGGARFMGDHAPVRPLAWWKSGQFIRYTTRVGVPRNVRAGSYTLWFGVFRKNERRPARSAHVEIVDDRASVGTVRVQR